jgi:UDP-3-O-[3-hydroxymyristoyl] glucosamine N-acyltransferase
VQSTISLPQKLSVTKGFFYLCRMQITAKEVANIIGGSLEGEPEVLISRPAKIEEGGEGTICFLGHAKYEPYAYTTTASAIIVDRSFVPSQPLKATLIRVENVREAFTTLLQRFQAAQASQRSGIAAEASIDPAATLGDEVTVGRFSIVEKGAVVGAGSVLHDQVYVGVNVRLGENVVLHPGVRILHDCVIGDRCVIHANAVIGSDGFGFVPDPDTGVYQKVPHLGNVVIEADVEIGACTTIDRATMGSTFIRRGVKLDNLIQVGHNVEVGAHTVIAALAGIAGSTRIGAHCRIGGQAGFVGHIEIADGVQIQAQTGVAASVTEKGKILAGTPGMPYSDYLRSYAVFKQLPLIYRHLNKWIKG